MTGIRLPVNWRIGASRYLVQAIFILVVMVIVFHLVLYGMVAYVSLTTPYQFDYGEGYHWYISQLASEGKTVYHDISEEPYITSVYTPVYYFASGGLIALFGSSIYMGRILSIIATVASAFLIFWIVRRVTGKWAGGAVAAGLYFASPIVIGWTTFFRVDMLALFFSLAGIALALKFLGTRKVLWAIPLFVLAVYTKQTYLAAPIAIILYLFLKDRKLSYWFTGLFAGLCGIIMGIGAALTNGQFFYHSLIYTGAQAFSINWTRFSYHVTLIFKYGVVVYFLAVYYFLGKLFRRETDLLGIYFLVATLIMLFLIGKNGSWVNYGLESYAVACILTGIVFEMGIAKVKVLKDAMANFARSAVLGILLLTLLIPFNWAVPRLPAEESEYPIVMQYIRETDGPIICEDASLLVSAGKDVIWEPSVFVQGGLAERGSEPTWNQAQFVSDIETGRFLLIILEYDILEFYNPDRNFLCDPSHERLTPEMAGAIRDNYRLKDATGRFWVYEPILGG